MKGETKRGLCSAAPAADVGKTPIPGEGVRKSTPLEEDVDEVQTVVASQKETTPLSPQSDQPAAGDDVSPSSRTAESDRAIRQAQGRIALGRPTEAAHGEDSAVPVSVRTNEPKTGTPNTSAAITDRNLKDPPPPPPQATATPAQAFAKLPPPAKTVVPDKRRPTLNWARAIAIFSACAIIGFVIGFGRSSPTKSNVAIYDEVTCPNPEAVTPIVVSDYTRGSQYDPKNFFIPSEGNGFLPFACKPNPPPSGELAGSYDISGCFKCPPLPTKQ